MSEDLDSHRPKWAAQSRLEDMTDGPVVRFTEKRTLVLTGEIQIEFTFGHGGRSLRIIVVAVVGLTIFAFALLAFLDTVFRPTLVHGRIVSRSFLVDR